MFIIFGTAIVSGILGLIFGIGYKIIFFVFNIFNITDDTMISIDNRYAPYIIVIFGLWFVLWFVSPTIVAIIKTIKKK